jgi:hypothetical protein
MIQLEKCNLYEYVLLLLLLSPFLFFTTCTGNLQRGVLAPLCLTDGKTITATRIPLGPHVRPRSDGALSFQSHEYVPCSYNNAWSRLIIVSLIIAYGAATTDKTHGSTFDSIPTGVSPDRPEKWPYYDWKLPCVISSILWCVS